MTERITRSLAAAAFALSAAGAVLGVAGFAGIAPFVLAGGIAAVLAAAWVQGSARVETGGATPEKPDFHREFALQAYSLVLFVVFLLLGLTELLAIPAALGHLAVFSELGLGLIEFYPVLIGFLACVLAGAILLAMGRPETQRALSARQRNAAYVGAGATALFLAGTIAASLGFLVPLGVHAERSVFVLAAALVTLFVFLKYWLRLPGYAEVSEWLEREKRLARSGALRKVAYGLLATAGVLSLLSLVSVTGLTPHGLGISAAGLAMLALLGATFNVGVSHVVPQLELDTTDLKDVRRKRHVILGAISIGLAALTAAVGALTFTAFLAQVGGVPLFRFLLEAYVAGYLFIFAVVIAGLIASVATRMRVKTEVSYSDKLRAMAVGMATLTIILVFFGVFIGSGLAEGSGIQIENAVLVMGVAVLALVQFVKARTLLPSVTQMIREAVTNSASADVDTKQRIRNRMVATYVLATVFVLGFAGFLVATSLGVVEPPVGSLGTDIALFTYVLMGIALLVVVVMRYFQGVNIDSRWQKKEQKDIGKKRLTADQVKRYLILGFSMGTAGVLFLLGALVMAGLLTSIGPFPLAKKYSTDFFVFAILIGLGPYGFYQSREAKRIEAIDQKFPEFLRDLAESQRAGMTLTEAVLTASKGNYGLLSGEIRKMAHQIEWGVSFTEALQRFARRVDTPLIKRTVSLVVQASEAGGNVVDVLTAAADDAREIQQIVKERKQSMSIYVMIIYIAFAVFIGVIAVLNAQFIPEVAKAVEKADGVSIGGLNFRAFDQEDFKTIFFHAAIIQGMGGGIVGGVMSGGKPVHGLRHSFLLVFIAWVLFRLVIG